MSPPVCCFLAPVLHRVLGCQGREGYIIRRRQRRETPRWRQSQWGRERERGRWSVCVALLMVLRPPPLRSSTAPWGCPGKCFSVKTMPVEEEHGHFLFRAVGDSHTVGKREARSSCSVVLLCPHLWLSLASLSTLAFAVALLGSLVMYLQCWQPTERSPHHSAEAQRSGAR